MKPYYAVIFTSILSDNKTGYREMAQEMESMARKQPGFLGFESARDGLGISVSYWKDLESIARWKALSAHRDAQYHGKTSWYSHYHIRICKVEREYTFNRT